MGMGEGDAILAVSVRLPACHHRPHNFSTSSHNNSQDVVIVSLWSGPAVSRRRVHVWVGVRLTYRPSFQGTDSPALQQWFGLGLRLMRQAAQSVAFEGAETGDRKREARPLTRGYLGGVVPNCRDRDIATAQRLKVSGAQ